MTVVLDASMALSFVLEDEFTEEGSATLAQIAREGALVPALWEVELLNGLRTAEGRGRLPEAAVAHALQAFTALPIRPSTRPVDRIHVLALAKQFTLSACDATYPWTAIAENLPLATKDARLSDAALAAGVPLVSHG